RDLHAGQWTADRAEHVGFRWSGTGAAAGFRKPIRLEHVETKPSEVAADLGIEGLSAGDEVTHLRSEQLVNAREEEFAQKPAQPDWASGGGDGHHAAKCHASEEAALLYLLHHALMNEVEELRHAAEECDVAFAQRAQQLGGVHLFEIN